MRAFVRAVLVAMILTIVASGPSHAVLWGRIDRPAMPQSGVPSDLPADVREAVQCLYTNGRVSESIEGMHRYALSVLRNAGQKAAPTLPLLVPMLSDYGIVENSGRVICPGHAEEVAGILKAMGDIPLEPLLPLFPDRDAKNRQYAATACRWIRDPRVVEPLLGALKDREVPVRYNAALALGEQGDVRAVEPLIAVRHDKNEDVRRAVAIGLGELATPECVPALVEALKDRVESVRRAAAEGLYWAVDHRPTALRRVGADTHRHINDPRAVEALVAALDDSDASVRIAAAQSLHAVDDPRAVKGLLGALKDKDTSVRTEAVAVLACSESAEPRVVQALVATLTDRDASVRTASAAGLVRMKEPRGTEALIAALQDRSASVRGQAAQALRHTTDPRAIEALVSILSHREAVRESVLDRVNNVFGRDAELYSRDTDSIVHARVSQALEGSKDPAAIQALTAALQDDSYAVRVSAALSLDRLDDSVAVEAMVRSLAHQIRLRAAARAVDVSGYMDIASGGLDFDYVAQKLVRPGAVETLISLLDDPTSAVAVVAASALGDLKDRRATVPLERTLLRDRYDRSLSKYDDPERADLAAAIALGKIGDPDAVLDLEAALRRGDTPMKQCAAGALSNIADRRAVGALAAAVQVHDSYLQVQAARGLRKITGQEFTGFEPDRWKQWWDQHKAEYE